MGATMDQMKVLNQLRKAQKSLKNEIVEVEAGDGAVTVQILVNSRLKALKSTQRRLTSTISKNLNIGLKTVCVTATPKLKKSQPTK